jgi:hypothetical protein
MTTAVETPQTVEVVPVTPAPLAVIVVDPFQVVHQGTVFRPGETAEVPEPVARYWLRNGWVNRP